MHRVPGYPERDRSGTGSLVPTRGGPAPLQADSICRYVRFVPAISVSRTSRTRVAALVTLLSLVGVACADDLADTAPPATLAPAATAAPTTTLMPTKEYDIVGTALANVVFTQLAGMLLNADLVTTMQGPGPFTVFAPTNAAFQKLPLDVLHAVEDDPDTLATALTYHVVAGELKAEDLVDGPLATVSGLDLTVSHDGDQVFINGNAITTPDVMANNGVIHVMSDVLVPPLGDIIDVATTLPGFATLAALVTQADLIDTLKGTGPFTVFAPTDGAFEALPAATLAAVQADPALLATVLTYHVVAGLLNTAALQEGKLTTVAGIDLTITKKDGVTFIDGHPIAVANVMATNGIIHVMGDVLVPEG